MNTYIIGIYCNDVFKEITMRGDAIVKDGESVKIMSYEKVIALFNVDNLYYVYHNDFILKDSRDE